MNKNRFSIIIILLVAAIAIVNLWKPWHTEANKKKTNLAVEKEFPASKNIQGAGLSQPQEGKPAPDFTLATLDGKTVKLSDYKGKKVILNFWATWCPPCKAEMPHMQNFYEQNKENGIEIVAVNLTSMDKGKTAVAAFVKDHKLTFKIPLDEEGTIGTQYQAFTIPTSYIIDSNGIITKKIIGPMDESIMENLTKNIE